MGKLNGCLKCLFVFFNVLFGLLGCLLVYGAVTSELYKDQAAMYHDQLAATGTSNGWVWVFAFGVMLISILGVVAACTEKELILKVFAGFMVGGMLIMLICGIIIAVYRSKVKQGFESTNTSELVEQFMEHEVFKDFLDRFQEKYDCCGVHSYTDWKTELPESCGCNQHDTFHCSARPDGYSGPDPIKSEPCSGKLFEVFDYVFKFTMGFCFGFAVIAFFGLLVSLLMIWQVRRHDSGTIAQSMAMKG